MFLIYIVIYFISLCLILINKEIHESFKECPIAILLVNIILSLMLMALGFMILLILPD